MEKKEKQLSLKVTDDLTVTVIPSSNHEFLMPTKDVAKGYGVSEGNIRNQLHRNKHEFQQGRHFDTAVCFSNTDVQTPHNKIFWTKRGIVRLGFFIKSDRARMFRDWAEELVLSKTKPRQQTLFDVPQKQLPARRNHNRLTSDRLLSIMADVAKIDDREIRLSLTSKLMMGGN